MSGVIYAIQGDGRLVEMTETAYESEKLLQGLLADYPKLLAGDQMDKASPRRWLLVSREAGVPATLLGADRWWIDHLFLDQDAIPTLAEVKRSEDTRIRREVVGQMLDYAACSVTNWPLERVQAEFRRTWEARGRDPDAVLAEFLASTGMNDAAEFWQRVKTNLQAGRIRLIFVADVIPDELRRVVEFLNRQMDPAEVLAVEVRQFLGEGLRTLVPRVIGLTAEAEQRKRSGSAAKRWEEEPFLLHVEQEHGANVAAVAREILAWGRATPGLILDWFSNGFIWSATFGDRGQHYVVLFHVLASARVVVTFQYWSLPPLDSEDARRAVLARLNAIQGVGLPQDAIAGRPSFPLALLVDRAKLRAFLGIFEWVRAGLLATQGDSGQVRGLNPKAGPSRPDIAAP